MQSGLSWKNGGTWPQMTRENLRAGGASQHVVRGCQNPSSQPAREGNEGNWPLLSVCSRRSAAIICYQLFVPSC